jgi:hypothetical protein
LQRTGSTRWRSSTRTRSASHVCRLITTTPFDRLLIAQAQLERCALLTADPQLLDYDVDLVWGGRERAPRPKHRRRG